MVDSRGLEGIYVQVFSGEWREWHLEAILRNLELMLAELQTWPLHQPMTLHNLMPSAKKGKLNRKFMPILRLAYLGIWEILQFPILL